MAAIVCYSGGFATFLPDWLWLSLMALIVSGVMLAIMYVFSIMYSNQNLNAFVKFETSELFATIIIIIAATAIVQGMCSIDVTTLFTNSPITKANFYSAIFDYYEMIDGRIIGWMTANHMMTMQMDQLASTTIFSKPLGLGLVTSPGAGLAGPIKNMLNQMTTALAVAFIINHAQIAVLEFMFYGMITYYLPIGIVLRSFMPTRRLGGAIIAIALGFLIIYPILTIITVNIVYSPFDQVGEETLKATKQLNNENLEKGIFADITSYNEWSKEVTKGTYIQNGDTFTLPGSNPSTVSTQIGETTTTWDVITNIITFNWLKGIVKVVIFSAVLLPLAAVSMAFVACFIMPAINILILVQAIKSMSKALGDEIDITVLTRMI